MNDLFKKALAFTLKYEGGYSNHPNDSGGPTNKGITQEVYDFYRKRHFLEPRSVKDITDPEVEDIYYTEYWVACSLDGQLPAVAIATFDFAVNSGVGRATRCLVQNGGCAKCLLQHRRQFLTAIGQGKNKVFLKGWLNRVEALEAYLNHEYQINCS